MTKRELEDRIRELERKEEIYYNTLTRIVNVEDDVLTKEKISSSDNYYLVCLAVAETLARYAIEN